MKVVILAGGFGTRISEEATPKFVTERKKMAGNEKNKELYFPEKGCHLGTNRSDNET